MLYVESRKSLKGRKGKGFYFFAEWRKQNTRQRPLCRVSAPQGTRQTPPLPSVARKALGKQFFFNKTSFPLFLFHNVFYKFVRMYFENTLSNSLNNAYSMLLRTLDHYFMQL